MTTVVWEVELERVRTLQWILALTCHAEMCSSACMALEPHTPLYLKQSQNCRLHFAINYHSCLLLRGQKHRHTTIIGKAIVSTHPLTDSGLDITIFCTMSRRGWCFSARASRRITVISDHQRHSASHWATTMEFSSSINLISIQSILFIVALLF